MVPIGRTRAIRLAVGAVLVCLVATTVPAAADPQERLEQIHQRQGRIQERIDRLADESHSLAGRIRILDAERSRVEGHVQSLDAQLHKLNTRIEKAKDELDVAQKHMALLTDQLQSILKELEARTEIYSARAVELYKAGPGAYFDGLLTSDSFADLYDRISYYTASVDADAALIDQIELLRDRTTDRREAVETEEARIAKAKLSLEKDREVVAAARQRQADLLAEREAVLGEKQTILNQVESKKDQWQRIAEQLEQDAAQIQSLLSSGGSTSSAAPGGTGQLAWPAAGPITSPFGWRTHPIFGDTRFHEGLDIGAPYGAPVFAADAGTVVFAGVMSGYGNVLVVDHGGGLATAYAHLSAFQVSYGQSVARGQQIANVGCTGYCTGPHLHFEVRVNGSPVDPMPYLQ
jgi:murein DD-endopeptidase MepM/ murein hydrolase activator NlpD